MLSPLTAQHVQCTSTTTFRKPFSCHRFWKHGTTSQSRSINDLNARVGKLACALVCKGGLLIEVQIQRRAVMTTKHPQRTNNCRPRVLQWRKKSTWSYLLAAQSLLSVHKVCTCADLWMCWSISLAGENLFDQNSSQTKICLCCLILVESDTSFCSHYCADLVLTNG